MAVVHVTDNQRPVHDALVEAGAALGLGGASDLDRASGKLRGLLRDGGSGGWTSPRAPTLVDGGGAGRVLDLVEAVVAGGEQPWQLRARPATADDADRLLAWRNDPAARLASREQDEVAPHAHRVWLEQSLASRDLLLLVVEGGRAPSGGGGAGGAADPPDASAVATVRWDRLDYGDREVDADWEVSITVAPEHRGNGLARPALAEASYLLAARHGRSQRLLARVHRDNRASQRLFESAGYVRQDVPPDGLGFVSYLRP